MFERIAASAAGYFFSVIIGYWAIKQLMDAAWGTVMRRLGANTPHPNPYPEHPEAIGLLERTLYTAAWQLAVPGFVGIWLVLKVAGGWKGWTEDLSVSNARVSGRTVFNVFLLGTGTSLAYGVIGALIIQRLNRDSWAIALLLGIVTVGATYALRWFLTRSPVRQGAV